MTVCELDGGDGRPATSAFTDPRGIDLFDPPAFRVVVHPDGSGDVMAVVGEIDLATAPQLHAALQRLLAAGHADLILDLSAVTFMDCSVLRFLVTAHEATRAAGGSLRTTGGNRLLARLLDASDLTSALALTQQPADRLSQ